MLPAILGRYDRAASRLSGRLPESIMLLFARIALAGVFWRSGQSKLEEGSWFTISDSTYELFRTEYAGVPLPPDLATVAATGAEHLFPVLLVLGLFTRLSAFALFAMTMVIQTFVYPEAWWPVHSLWVALALALMVRGGGLFSLDTPLARSVRQ
jgi:putative oxidoreductase